MDNKPSREEQLAHLDQLMDRHRDIVRAKKKADSQALLNIYNLSRYIIFVCENLKGESTAKYGEAEIKHCFEVLLASEAAGDIYAAIGFETYPGEGQFSEDLNGYADNYEIKMLIGNKPFSCCADVNLLSRYKICWSELTSTDYGPICVINNKEVGYGDKWLKTLSNRMVAILTEQMEKILSEDAE